MAQPQKRRRPESARRANRIIQSRTLLLLGVFGVLTLDGGQIKRLFIACEQRDVLVLERSDLLLHGNDVRGDRGELRMAHDHQRDHGGERRKAAQCAKRHPFALAADSVVVYQQESTNVLSKVFASLGNGVCAVVEYFK